MGEEVFRTEGYENIHHSNGCSEQVGLQRFTDFFGASPLVCSIIWDAISNANAHPHGSRPKYFLAALHFLRVYNIETVNRALFNHDEKTLRKWVWMYISIIAREVKVVRNRIYHDALCFNQCSSYTPFQVSYSMYKSWCCILCNRLILSADLMGLLRTGDALFH